MKNNEKVSINFEEPKIEKKKSVRRITEEPSEEKPSEDKIMLMILRKLEMMDSQIKELKEKPKEENKIEELNKTEIPKPINSPEPIKIIEHIKIPEIKPLPLLELQKKEKRGFFNFFKKKKEEQEIFYPVQVSEIPTQPISLLPVEKVSVENVTMQTNEDYNCPERCPLCDSKIKKGKVQKKGIDVSQVYKCKNSDCIFVKEFKFKRGA